MGLNLLPVNWFTDATITATPAAVTTLPETNLQLTTRDAWRSTDLSSQVIAGNWGGDVRPISSWGVWPTVNGGSLMGAQVRVQLYSDLAASAQVYDSTTLDFFAYTGQGWGNFNWGQQPWGVDPADRTARLAPIVKYFAEVGASAFKVTFTNAGGVDTSYFEARRIWLSQYIAAPYNAETGAAPAWMSSSELKRGLGGTLRRVARARWRALRFDTFFLTEADRSAWSDLMYVCDPANEIVISLFPGNANPKLERDFTVMGSLEVLNPQVFADLNYHTLQLAILES